MQYLRSDYIDGPSPGLKNCVGLSAIWNYQRSIASVQCRRIGRCHTVFPNESPTSIYEDASNPKRNSATSYRKDLAGTSVGKDRVDHRDLDHYRELPIAQTAIVRCAVEYPNFFISYLGNFCSPAPTAMYAISQQSHPGSFTYSDDNLSHSSDFVNRSTAVQRALQMPFQLRIDLTTKSAYHYASRPIRDVSHPAVSTRPTARSSSPPPLTRSYCSKHSHTSAAP